VLDRYENRHRVAIWSQIPRAPYALLDPLIRHELEHAAQWQRHGRAYTDMDQALRKAWDVGSSNERYLTLPTEREANLASAAYAVNFVDAEQLRRLRRKARHRHLVDAGAQALESDSLSLTVEALREAGDKFLPHFNTEQRKEWLQNLEQSARSWPPDPFEGLRDDESNDLVVVTDPYWPE
jgi:hypothetical protein